MRADDRHCPARPGGATSISRMDPTALSAGFAAVLFLGILGLLEVGRRLGRRRAARDVDGARAGLGVVDGAIFALLGLLVAFSFSGAASRFEARRSLITDEANAIGTAWLRLDLLPADAQPAFRERFRRYVDARIALFRVLPDYAAARAENARADGLQSELWKDLVPRCQTDAVRPYANLLLGAFNEMFDRATLRNAALFQHPPRIVMAMLAVAAFLSATLAGFGMAGARQRSWLHYLGFAAILSVTVYVTFDLERPRAGLIRIDEADQVLINLRQSMDR